MPQPCGTTDGTDDVAQAFVAHGALGGGSGNERERVPTAQEAAEQLIWARFGRRTTSAYRLGAAGALVAMECMLVCVRVALSARSLDHRAVRLSRVS